MEYIASLSYGKDSMYMLEVIHLNGLPLDRIVTVDVMATATISGDYPEMAEFKVKADKFILDRYGIVVQHLTSKYVSYENLVYKVFERGKKVGYIRGVTTKHCNWCNSDLKMQPLLQVLKNCISYVGYAIDEKNSKRQEKIKGYIKKGYKNDIYPLVDYKITEQNAYDWCKSVDMLAPNYTHSNRGGCWFCHNQSLTQWKYLYDTYPKLWELAKKWENDSNYTYRPDYSLQCLEDERFSKGCTTKRDLNNFLEESMFIGSL